MRIRMYPAGNGDAFLISAMGSNVLFDGGYAQTFDDHISRDLRDLSLRGERLDLLVASHIDSDHISGLIRFLSVNGSSAAPRIVPIGDIWHNSLRSLTARHDAELRPSDREIVEAIHQRGHPSTPAHAESDATPISARQGSSLASLIREGGYRWNLGDGTTSITLEHMHMIPLPGGNIRVIGPMRQRLDGLLKWWKSRLRQMGYTGPSGAGDLIDDAFEFMCEHATEGAAQQPVALSAGGYKQLHEVYEPDISITNGSSIATITELGGVRILMLGDAWAEDVVHALRFLQSRGCSMVFDAIKISHHGSLRNTSPELLQLVDAPTYMVSSNSMVHGHPHIEVLAAIVDRPAPFSRTLYLNYTTPASILIRSHRSRSGTPFAVHETATGWIEIEGTRTDG